MLQVNGYQLKDKEEELKLKATRLKARITKANKYFESEKEADPQGVYALIDELDSTLVLLACLSDLHCYYNTRVVGNGGASLQTMIKMQGVYSSLQSTWQTLAVEADRDTTSYGYYGKNKEDKTEYPKYSIEAEECNSRVDGYSDSARDLKGQIRITNARPIDIPEYMLNWAEPLFS